MKKVIGIVSTHYLPHLGGVERYVYNLARELKKRKWQVIIITSQMQGMLSHEINEGIEIYRFPCYEFMGGRMPVIKYDKQFRHQTVLLRQIKFDLFLVNTRLYTLSAWGIKYCRKEKIPVTLIEHSTEHIVFDNHVISKLGQVYEHMLTWYIKRGCSSFMGVSEQCNVWLKHYGIKADGIMYNAVNEEEYQEVKTVFRERLKISDNVMIITYVGRLIPQKGVRKLIQACKSLEKKGALFYLLIAGDGDLASEIEKSADRQIVFLGSLKHSEVISLLVESDIYCMPTDYPEGFPTAILEAAMCGCCILATAAGGTKELVTDDRYGWILEENSEAEIEEKLGKLLEDQNIVRELGNRVRERVKKEFTWRNTVDMFEKTCITAKR